MDNAESHCYPYSSQLQQNPFVIFRITHRRIADVLKAMDNAESHCYPSHYSPQLQQNPFVLFRITHRRIADLKGTGNRCHSVHSLISAMVACALCLKDQWPI